jgi:hypothetical protein
LHKSIGDEAKKIHRVCAWQTFARGNQIKETWCAFVSLSAAVDSIKSNSVDFAASSAKEKERLPPGGGEQKSRDGAVHALDSSVQHNLQLQSLSVCARIIN